MEINFTQKMKDVLLESKKEIISNLANNNEEFKKMLEGKGGDDIDVASDAIDSKMLETFNAAEINRLKAIDNALFRIEQGRYGMCLKCGKKIPEGRLEAIPSAALCLECKAKEEKRKY